MTKQEIGTILKKLRNRKGMTQKDVAEKIGRTQQIIGHWETGYSQPDADTLFILCDLYDASIDESFGFSKSTEFESIIAKYRELDNHGKELVSLVIDKEYERMEISKKQKNKNTSLIQENISNYEVPLCQYPYILGGASAGLTSFLTDIEIESIKAPVCDGADFIISVSGDSMEPTYYDGEKVYVQKTPELNFGDIGIFSRGNELFIKEYGEDGLISHNPKYKMIKGTEDIQTVGRVIEKVEL